MELDLRRSFPITSFLILLYSTVIGYVPRELGVFAFYGGTFFVHFSFVFVLVNLMPKLCKKN